MDWKYGFDGFVFDNDQIVNNHIDSVTCLDFLPIVNNWRNYFRQDFPSAFAQFIGMTLLISGFEQSRSEFLMNLEGCINNVFGNCLNTLYPNFCPLLWHRQARNERKGFLLFHLSDLSALCGSIFHLIGFLNK